MRKYITRADIALFVFFILLGTGMTVYSAGLAARSGGGSTVRITVDGELYGTYPLSRDNTIVIEQNGHHNEVLIENGSVRMKNADCANQICVNDGAISKTNQSIICLPNRVMVEITGGEEEFDVIAQ